MIISSSKANNRNRTLTNRVHCQVWYEIETPVTNRYNVQWLGLSTLTPCEAGAVELPRPLAPSTGPGAVTGDVDVRVPSPMSVTAGVELSGCAESLPGASERVCSG